MLKIFYGPEGINKEKFIFDRINPGKKTILIVPDQFSLQMERNVLEYFREKSGTTALLNLMVTDFTVLGHKVIKEAGGRPPELIDRYGRHMLLTLLISRLAKTGQLSVYQNMWDRTSFAAETNQLISEMKRYGITPLDIEGALENTGSYLKLKLTDIEKIFAEYEEAIEGRFTDSEDYVSFYGRLMEKADYEASRKNPEIVHFAGDERPWYQGSKNPYREEYEKYLSMTPYRDVEPVKGKERYMAFYHAVNVLSEKIPGFRAFASRVFYRIKKRK